MHEHVALGCRNIHGICDVLSTRVRRSGISSHRLNLATWVTLYLMHKLKSRADTSITCKASGGRTSPMNEHVACARRIRKA